MTMDHDSYLALRESAAVMDLPGRGHLQATGEDRARLLHAMTTNHVEELVPGDCRYAFFLSSQGRILADVNIVCTEAALLLDTEPEAAEPIYQHLDRYIIADDVTLANLTERMSAIALEGPQSAAVLERMGIDAPASGHWTAWRTFAVAAVSATGQRGFRFFVPRSERESVIEWINGAGAVKTGHAEWNTVRLENGVARFGEDFTEREIPHETRLIDRAISFSKGCYLGQEIVERVRSRGQVNRQLMHLAIPGQTAPAAHTKLSLEGREVGEVTSAAYSPEAGLVFALGYVRAQTIASGVQYSFEGGTATIAAPRPL